VGIVVSDAGKQRSIYRFVLLGSVLDALEKKDPSWGENFHFVKSKYIYSHSSWNILPDVGSSSSGSSIIDQSRVVSTPASTASQLHPSNRTSWPETFKKDISKRTDSVLLKVKQYKKFVDDWEGSRELRSGENAQALPETAGLRGAPTIPNWRIRPGFSKVQGRVFHA
jgi:hypothetical protein